jgi:hypothetical protein
MMESEFQMFMVGELTFFLGIQVKQMKQGTYVHQSKYIKDLMTKFNMAELKPVSTLMSSVASLGPDEDGDTVDQREYMRVTRPNIQFVVGLCARFQASPRSSHRTTVQWFFRYLKHTPEFRIWYSASSSLNLVGFFNADFVDCGIDRKSTFGICHFLGYSLICGLLENSLQLHSPPPRLSM